MNLVNKRTTALLFALTLAFFGQLSPANASIEDAVCSITSVSNLGTKDEKVIGRGAGMFLDHSGHILTANHVVEEGSRVALLVVVENQNRAYRARVVGRNRFLDCAVLKIDNDNGQNFTSDDFDIVVFGDSDTVKQRDTVYVVGNPHGRDKTASKGIVGRVKCQERGSPSYITERIQVSAGINPGNSGGPVVNEKNEVIGMVVEGMKGSDDMGFAVPINLINVAALKTGGFHLVTTGFDCFPYNFPRVGTKNKADISDMIAIGNITGIQDPENLIALSKGTIGHSAFIMKINSQRATMFRNGDVVISIDGVKIGGGMDIRVLLLKKSPLDKVSVKILRAEDGRLVEMTVNLTLF